MLNWITHRRSKYDLHSDFANIKDALSDTSHDIKGRIAEILANSYDDVKDKSIEAKDSVAHYVARKPFKSLGVAMLFGMIIGFLFRE